MCGLPPGGSAGEWVVKVAFEIVLELGTGSDAVVVMLAREVGWVMVRWLRGRGC
jgi:hypothetical protein